MILEFLKLGRRFLGINSVKKRFWEIFKFNSKRVADNSKDNKSSRRNTWCCRDSRKQQKPW